jgi:hypothetical protein
VQKVWIVPKSKKVYFSMKESKLLGHIVSVGVKIDPNRVEAIKTRSLPSSKK